MPAYSRFAPYGLQAYSSNPTAAQRIYDAAIAGEGGQFGTDGAQEAHVYAIAMEIGRADAAVSLAYNQQDPRKASVFLSQLEHDWGLSAVSGASDDWRRDRLQLARQLGWGARRNAIEDGLRALLGDGFISYRTFTSAESEPSPTDWTDCPGTFKRAGTPNKVVTLTSAIYTLGTPQWYVYSDVGGSTDPLIVGDTLAVEPGRWGLAEHVEIIGLVTMGSTLLQGTFTKPHDAGAMAVSGPCPTWPSIQRHSLVVVELAVLSNGSLMRAIQSFMEAHVEAVSTWDVVCEVSSGYCGPFTVAGGLIGQTTIGATTTEP